jgi:hypothetical protein
MSCMVASGSGLCPLPIVLAEADTTIHHDAFDPSDIHRGALGELLLTSQMRWQWASKNHVLDDDDDVTARELTSCSP